MTPDQNATLERISFDYLTTAVSAPADDLDNMIVAVPADDTRGAAELVIWPDGSVTMTCAGVRESGLPVAVAIYKLATRPADVVGQATAVLLDAFGTLIEPTGVADTYRYGSHVLRVQSNGQVRINKPGITAAVTVSVDDAVALIRMFTTVT